MVNTRWESKCRKTGATSLSGKRTQSDPSLRVGGFQDASCCRLAADLRHPFRGETHTASLSFLRSHLCKTSQEAMTDSCSMLVKQLSKSKEAQKHCKERETEECRVDFLAHLFTRVSLDITSAGEWQFPCRWGGREVITKSSTLPRSL